MMWNEPTKERLNALPRLKEQEKTSMRDQMVYLHFFIGNCDWWATEYDGEDTFFGFARLGGDDQNSEWGHFSFTELKALSIQGVEIDCELAIHFKPQPCSVINAIKTYDDGVV